MTAYAILACLLPALLLAATYLLLPTKLEPAEVQDLPSVQTRLISLVVYLILAFATGATAWLGQNALIRLSRPPGAEFFHSLGDFSMVTAIFVGMALAVPLMTRILGEGARWAVTADTNRMKSKTPKEAMASYRRWALGTGIVAAIFTFMTMQAFISVQEGEISFSSFWSLSTESRKVSNIRELALYSQRIAPDGGVVDNSYVEVRFDDGTVLDTYVLMEDHLVEPLIVALQKNSEQQIEVVRPDVPGKKGGG